MTPYSCQLLLSAYFKASRFRNLAYKRDLCSLAKTLKLKARGLGKYDLANMLAKALLEKGIVSVTDDANVKCSKREEITVLKTVAPASDVVATDVARDVTTPESSEESDEND